jgi:hypothetical protein
MIMERPDSKQALGKLLGSCAPISPAAQPAELEADPEAAHLRLVPDAAMVYFHLLLRGLGQRST